MSRAVVVRYQMRPESAAENQSLVEDVFTQLAKDDPGGFGYAAFRLADGVSFVHVLVGEADGLGSSAAFGEFQRAFGDRAAGPPVVSDAELIGSYRLLGT